MEALRENRLEVAVSSSTESVQGLLASQKELFYSQIAQLQNIVVTQCKLTGVNPLSQEMAAGALSIKIGKRPRDLLNPKAIKYMQSVFSIKDAISKKESREISALFGVTVTQVREFFTGQRSRVRKFVRLSRDKAIRSNACNEAQDGLPTSSDPSIPLEPVPLNCVAPTNAEDVPSCSAQGEVLPGLDESDKHFIQNIFSFLRKEETFFGQVNLLEWILQIRNPSILSWFLTKGGVMILATWLSQAAIEEQTSVLHVILEVLCHLPLHKALPVHMSAILQSVNRLRFYRASDISNRARFLLSRWSKLFARSQAMKKPNSMKSSSDAQDEMLLKQSIGEIMGNEAWESKVDISEEILTHAYEISENSRKLESLLPLKLITASTDDSNKKFLRGVSSSQIRERRKVLLVEQPGQKTAGRSPQVARSVPAPQGRPLSADDIQKAKMRAQFMQSKYGKPGTSSDESPQMKAEGPSRSSSPQTSIFLSASKAPVRPRTEEQKKPVMLATEVSNLHEAPVDNKMSLDLEEPLWKKCKRVHIPWQTPPEMRIGGGWSVGAGENSKEVEVQKNRIRREKEIIYKIVQEVPLDPKEPWDHEMDYDDTLTPEIPTEQLPDADGAETVVLPRENQETPVTSATTTSQNTNENMPEPDLELLAILLKNPELVFALTSGQGGSLSSDQTVKLLDMIKAKGVGSLGSLTGLGTKAEEKVEVSLPSPTPSSDPVTSGWRPEFAQNPFPRQNAPVNRESYNKPAVDPTIPSEEKLPTSSLAQPQIPSTNFVVTQQLAVIPTLSQQPIPQLPLPQTEKRLPPVMHSLPHNAPSNSSDTQMPVSEIAMNVNLSLPNPLVAASSLIRVETLGNVKPTRASVIANSLAKPPVAFPSPTLLPTPTPPPSQLWLQPPFIHEPPVLSQPWRARQGLASNPSDETNYTNYNALVGGPMQASFPPGSPPGRPWEGDAYVNEPKFESWSPENSPIRSPNYTAGWNYPEPRLNLGRNYRPERSRLRNPSGYRDHSRDGNRRWRDRRR